MTVSGSRAGIEFQQEIQQQLVVIADSGLPAMILGPFFQIIEALAGEKANQDAIALDSNGDALLYNGDQLQVDFFSDPDNLEGAVALPSLLDKSAVLPNDKVVTDAFFKVFLNPPGTDEFVELEKDTDFDLVINANNATVGILLHAGLQDSVGAFFSAVKKGNVVIGLRALRRDFSRKPLKTDINTFSNLAGGSFGEENPAALGMQKVFEVAQDSSAFLVAVDEVSDAEPEGTYNSYLRALEAAGTVEIYGMVPLTRSLPVLNAVKVHVLDLSKPEGRKERRGLFTVDLPTKAPNTVKFSGVGDLSLVHAAMEHKPGSGAGFHIIGEAKQGGAAPNNVLALEILAGSGSGPITTKAGNTQIASSTEGTTAIGSGTLVDVTVATPLDFTALGVVAGDLIRYDIGGSTADVVGDGTRLKVAGKDFKALGTKPGDKIVVVAEETEVVGIATITTPNDTLILKDAQPVATGVTWVLTLVLTIVEVAPAAATDTLIVNAKFDEVHTEDLTYEVLDGVEKIITVDLVGLTDQDSENLVVALNANANVAELAEFFIGDLHRPGTPVDPLAAEDFVGGLDIWTQFFANADLTNVVPGTGPDFDDEDFLDLESENFDFGIKEVRTYNGSVVVHDPLGELTGLKVTETYSIFEEGATLEIVTPLGTEPDRQAQAESLATFPARFKSRRIIVVNPELGITTVNGIDVKVPSYYIAATLAGLFASLPSEQGHSELPLPGWVSLEGSNDIFRESQLSLMTAAGHWIYVQDEEGGVIVSRKQYTTDTSGDITAEASFTTIADDYQKIVRRSVTPLLGVNNITPDLIDRVRTIIQSVGTSFTTRKAMRSATLNSLEVSQEPGDLTTLIGDVTLEFFGPFNLLRLKVLL